MLASSPVSLILFNARKLNRDRGDWGRGYLYYVVYVQGYRVKQEIGDYDFDNSGHSIYLGIV